ncbi:glycoside hydrolase [Rhodotorula sp. JG-1b]|nr:glycoside hydrolase [Rhodotorula sp. JG-1b]
MPHQSRRHRYYDSDDPPPSSSGSEDGNESTDASDEEQAPIRHHHRRHHHKSHGSSDNRVWLALAGFVLLAAIVVAGYYFYNKQGTTGSDAEAGADVSEPAGALPGPTGSDSTDAPDADTSPSTGGGVDETPAVTEPSGATSPTGTGTGSAGASASGTAAPTGTGLKKLDPPKPAPTGGGGGGGGGAHKILGFWENWTGQSVAETEFSSFVAVPGTVAEKGKLDLGEAKEGLVKEWVSAAKKANCKAMLSIGGWSGSSTFSSLVATDQSRKDFAATISDTLDAYEFDGCDIDWEYPGRAGDTQDFDVKNDLTNFLRFLWELRAKLGKDKLISADTSATPWVGSDGNPSNDLSGFATLLDFITIMASTYDSVTYSSKTTGPNFAYEDTCAPAAQKFNILKTVKSWVDAKFPANKIMLGLATYGYAWKVSELKDSGGADGASSSIYQNAASTFTAADGSLTYDKIKPQISSMKRTFDKCSSTPFLYSSSTQLFISYDDEESFKVKGAYAGKNGLMGCSLYAGMTQNKDSSLAKVAKTVC